MKRLYSLTIYLAFLCLVLAPGISSGQRTNPIETILLNCDSCREIASDPVRYRLQIIYTQIDRDAFNTPHLTTYSFRPDPHEYFYPASLVKLPVAALSLEKINRIRDNGHPLLDKYSAMITDSSFACQSRVLADSTAPDKRPSVAHYIRKMLLTSNNDAYNRLYEFLGQQYIHQTLLEKGYDDIRIVHRFAPCDTQMNRHTNKIDFFDGDKLICSQPPAFYPFPIAHPLGEIVFGFADSIAGDPHTRHPKKFTYSNYLSLKDAHDILVSLIFPERVPSDRAFDLQPDDYKLLRRYLALMPREADFPSYKGQKQYTDAYKKYLVYGARPDTIRNTHLRILNVVGQAYGFLADCAYMVDFQTHTEFFLSVVVYINEDDVMDSSYPYREKGFPFLKALGEAFYRYEKERKRHFLPDLQLLRQEIEKP